jgi:hypothetical protein
MTFIVIRKVFVCLFVQVGEGFVRLVAEGQTGDMLVIMPGSHIILLSPI